MNLLQEILAEQPIFHNKETEIKRSFTLSESGLRTRAAMKLLDGGGVCYGISPDVADFIYHSVTESSITLEIGAGISTLIFALKKSEHLAITPNESEIIRIKAYAKAKGINMAKIRFLNAESDKCLPESDIDDLDLVLIDGKHAFPWPILDWFYTADRLRKMGFMIIDDVQLFSVTILKDFMNEDPRWNLHKSFGKTCVFQKLQTSIHDVAWHMQPYLINRLPRKPIWGSFVKRIKRYCCR